MIFGRECFYNDLTEIKPRILISACLAGERVRYDGEDKSYPVITQFFSEHAEVTRICPEVSAGFGIPRPPVALQQTSSGIRALGVKNKQIDATLKLAGFSQAFLQQTPFHAAILKSRSPSCGFGTTPVFQQDREIGIGNGIFADALHQRWPACLITDENQLNTVDACQTFLFHCYVALDKTITPMSEMVFLHAHYQQDGYYKADTDK